MQEERDGGARTYQISFWTPSRRLASSAAAEAALLTAVPTSARAMLTTVSAIDRSDRMPALPIGATELGSSRQGMDQWTVHCTEQNAKLSVAERCLRPSKIFFYKITF